MQMRTFITATYYAADRNGDYLKVLVADTKYVTFEIKSGDKTIGVSVPASDFETIAKSILPVLK